MKFLLIISIAILCLSLFKCGTNNNKVDFCGMLNNDQSNLKSDEHTDEENVLKLENRKRIFIENYETFKDLSLRNSLPVIPQTPSADSCLYWSTIMTFIHVSQTRPDIFYSKSNVDIFSKQLQKGTLDKEHLKPAVKMGFMSSICDTLRPSIQYALKEWKIDNSFINENKFSPCD